MIYISTMFRRCLTYIFIVLKYSSAQKLVDKQFFVDKNRVAYGIELIFGMGILRVICKPKIKSELRISNIKQGRNRNPGFVSFKSIFTLNKKVKYSNQRKMVHCPATLVYSINYLEHDQSAKVSNLFTKSCC